MWYSVGFPTSLSYFWLIFLRVSCVPKFLWVSSCVTILVKVIRKVKKWEKTLKKGISKARPWWSQGSQQGGQKGGWTSYAGSHVAIWHPARLSPESWGKPWGNMIAYMGPRSRVFYCFKSPLVALLLYFFVSFPFPFFLPFSSPL